MEERRTFSEIYPELQILVGINEIRFENGMNWNKFEQIVKDIVKFNKTSMAGKIPRHILDLFQDNSREHLKKFFEKKYQEINDDRARMMADPGFMGARNLGASNRRRAIANQARLNQSARAEASIIARRSAAEIDRRRRLPTTQVPGHNLLPRHMNRYLRGRKSTKNNGRKTRARGKSPKPRRSRKSRKSRSTTKSKASIKQTRRSRAPSRNHAPSRTRA